jgi:hypothetical protein
MAEVRTGVGKETSFICGGENFFVGTDWKEGVGCRVWGVGKETSFICGGENFFIGTDS